MERPGLEENRLFEKLVRDVMAGVYKQRFALYGRRGQDQHGADVTSQYAKIVVPCKAYAPGKYKGNTAQLPFQRFAVFFRPVFVSKPGYTQSMSAVFAFHGTHKSSQIALTE